MTRRVKVLSRSALAAAAVAAVGIAIFAYLRLGPASLPRPGNPRYEEMVSAFASGVAALDTDANVIARDALTRATKLIPEEPSAWADLGLAEIRLSNFDGADKALAKARGLAPESGEVERLIALLESRRGRFAESIAHLKIAIARNPGDVRARYALGQELERQGDGEAEALRAMGEMLKTHPDNLAVLLDRARLAARAGDSAALSDTVARLGKQSASWPPRAQEQYRSLVQAAGGTNLKVAATRVIVLRNMLIQLPAFRRSLDAVQEPIGTIGEPIANFLRLTAPSSTPAPPDLAITFAVSPAGEAPSPASAVFVVPDAKGAAPFLLAADGREVRRVDPPGVIAPFPGGPAATPPSAAGVVVADWTSDEAMDLVLAGAGGVRFLKREADGSFADVTAATKLGPDALAADAFGAWVADVEMDGDLDFVIGVRKGATLVLVNHGDGTFEVSRPFEKSADVRGFAWADLDRDGDPDAATIDDAGTLRVFMNERSGRFAERPVPGDLGRVFALAVADANSDGAIDLLLLTGSSVLRLSDRDDGRSWESAAVARREAAPGPGIKADRLIAADVDNNGAIDFIVSGRAGTEVWLGGRAGEPWAAARQAPALGVFAVADLNDDGRLDLAGVADPGQASIGINGGTRPYRWLDVRPRAAKIEGDARINSFGIGGEVEVRAGLLVQRQVIAGPTAHFGLGEHAKADVARVVWPNGTSQAEFGPEADQAIVAEQRLKGSCPFVYAFDGSRMAFVTDFLWRSPLGLRINAQDTAGVSQTEDRVKIRGDQLAPRDGYYDIRLTAELWETHYWDHVSLMVVDHPEGTDVFVDERFARKPPSLDLHATGRPIPVASARDDQGRDVTDLVRTRDGRYLDTFGRGFYQGVTRDHWVEVEIGDDIPRDRKLWLVANGWIHPTDSSINVALGQGTHDAPRGLVLEVPTDDGRWVEARADLGFPAGKNKTILVDLDGLPRRFRLRTNLEIFWDALAVATAEDAASVKTQRIAPTVADLRLRGYSETTRRDDSSPEVPVYDKLVGTRQRWNDLIGHYTRFGDVRELLEKVDDRYVIANAGDEVALRFPAPPPPPEGWLRDFVLIGDGWNKDGDYNTAYSRDRAAPSLARSPRVQHPSRRPGGRPGLPETPARLGGVSHEVRHAGGCFRRG